MSLPKALAGIAGEESASRRKIAKNAYNQSFDYPSVRLIHKGCFQPQPRYRLHDFLKTVSNVSESKKP